MIETALFKMSQDSIDFEAIDVCAKIINDGGLVVFPTETVYGLGADATNPEAAKRIYAAKGRPSDNPLIIHISEPTEAEKYTYTTELYYKLASRFMPGPITIVMRAKDTVPTETRGGLETVAVRCPENPIARALIARAGVPIAAPSANLSGSPSPTNADHVIDDMYNRCEAIIDGGDSEIGLESTIIKIEDEETVTLLRPGKVTIEDLREFDITVNVSTAVLAKLGENEVALSPGMKYKHYSPKAELYLLDGEPRECVKYAIENRCGKTAIISYSEYIDMANAIDDVKVYDFGRSGDLSTQAHLLFDILREVDKDGNEIVYAPLPDKSGIGLALYNRMIRAAAHKIIKL